MTPASFSFSLTVPSDPEGVTVIAAVAAHAVEYAKLDATAGAVFLQRVREVARQALQSATDDHCLVVFAAADGELTVTIGSESASQPLSA
jgi:hypothetical protein